VSGMNESLVELVRISRAVGRDSSLILGGFGNTSAKTADGRYMYIKASGTALKDMTRKKGWRRLKLQPVRTILKNRAISGMDACEREARIAKKLFAACEDGVERGNKPSVESGFHSILDRFVIHLHPVAVLAYLCAKNGRAELKKLFKNEEFPPVWVSYTTPGYLLAKKIEKTIERYRSRYGRDPAVIFLQNHGLTVTAENANTALRLVRKTVRKCRNRLKKPKEGKARPVSRQQIIEAGSVIRNGIFQMTGRKITVRYYINDTIAEFMARKDAARLCSQPVVTGDELICVGGPPIWLDKWDKQTILDKSKHRIGDKIKQPVCFLIRSLGLFVAGDKGRQELMKDIITANLAVRSYASGFGGAHCLNKRHLKFLANIEVR